jgi:hypothetical protein
MSKAIRTPERIEHAINKVARLVLYLLLLVGLVEAASWAAIQFYNWVGLPSWGQPSLNAVVADPDPAGEVFAVWSNSVLFPTRWYTNQPNFRGRYVVTDDAGFRIDPTAVTEAKSIGFFGGSTMFSIVTRQEHTIPAQVHLPGFNSLNFGVSGYSTAAELPTLLEALRRYTKLEVAVFYDGVNELGNFVEMLQDGAPEAFAAVGYYHRGSIDAALASYLSWRQAGVIVQTPAMRIAKRVWLMVRAQAVSQSQSPEEIARSIAAQYFANIRDINLIARAYSVAPIFVLQPNIFTTGKRLTPAELAIRDRDRTIVAQLAPLVRSAIMSDPRARTYDVVDASDVFDAADGEIFYDWSHVGGAGNKIVADRMIALISARLQ